MAVMTCLVTTVPKIYLQCTQRCSFHSWKSTKILCLNREITSQWNLLKDSLLLGKFWTSQMTRQDCIRTKFRHVLAMEKRESFIPLLLILTHGLELDPKYSVNGAVAQLGERIVRNDKVGSSILPGSTIKSRISEHRLHCSNLAGNSCSTVQG